MKTLFLSLFAIIFATFAAAQGGYVVRTGDTLSIEVIEDPSLNRQALVLPNGTIDFPFVGTVTARGKTASQISASISAGIASNFAAPPNVFVSVSQLRPVQASNGITREAPVIQIFLLGEWNEPGAQEVPPGTTMLQALSLGGGFSNFAATKRIQVRRTDSQTGHVTQYVVDYYAIERGMTVVNNFTLREGDVIVAPQRRLFE